MKKHLFLFLVFTSITITVNGQNLFFIGEKSFPSTESYSLDANSRSENDLNIAFAKDAVSAFVAVRLKIGYTNQFHGKLIIYLNDGNVISLDDQIVRDYVDGIASAVYFLPKEDLLKMEEGNINTVRYSMLLVNGMAGAGSGNYSSTNRSNINFPVILSDFYK